MALTLEKRPLDRLVPYDRNARTHSDEQVAQIGASIAEFGFVNPVLIGGDGVVIAGHGRLSAAQRLGMTEVPVIVLDHLTEAQRRALVIADNRIAENAGWDENLLRAELAALRETDFDLDLLGFAEAELANLLDAIKVDADAASPQGSDSPEAAPPASTLAERFGIPPFSVLNAREGWWQTASAPGSTLVSARNLGAARRSAARHCRSIALKWANLRRRRAGRLCRPRTIRNRRPAATVAASRSPMAERSDQNAKLAR
jgi:ParB-like nuclease domain